MMAETNVRPFSGGLGVSPIFQTVMMAEPNVRPFSGGLGVSPIFSAVSPIFNISGASS